ncbi:MAG: hypothetical protein ACXVYY_09055 [Oryzihumus sp.]
MSVTYDGVEGGSSTQRSGCPACGAAAPPNGQFCGGCGHRLESAGHDQQVAMPSSALIPQVEARASRSSRKWLATAASLVALGAATWGVLDDLHLRSGLESKRRALTATQHFLSDTQAKLTDTTAQLGETKQKLASTQSNLASKTKALAASQAALQGAQRSLTDANGRIDVQSGQIVTLKTCLGGVSTALHDLAYDDYSGVISALDAVQVSCQAANKIVG